MVPHVGNAVCSAEIMAGKQANKYNLRQTLFAEFKQDDDFKDVEILLCGYAIRRINCL